MQRQQQLTLWLQSKFPDESFQIEAASADASFRRYYRASFSGRTLIIMDAPTEHEDCRPFLQVAQLFEKAGVHVPHIYATDLEQGFLLLSDLGNTTYFQALNPENARELYALATDALIKIQLASKEHELPPYDEALLLREMRLFPEWYIKKHLNITLTDAQNAKLETVFARILANNLAQPRIYVHRDYHSRNLMYCNPDDHGKNIAPDNEIRHDRPSPLQGAFWQSQNCSQGAELTPRNTLLTLNPLPTGEEANEHLREFHVNDHGGSFVNPGIIDFQDAVYGPITYDLVSLFKDAYLKWDEEQCIDWLIAYWQKARSAHLPVHADFGQFYWDYEWMGVQRHLKVLGIFARLCHRDGKDGYLKDMPLVWDYLYAAAARYVELKPLFNLLNEIKPPQETPTGYGF
jgi:hypothetical protein